MSEETQKIELAECGLVYQTWNLGCSKCPTTWSKDFRYSNFRICDLRGVAAYAHRDGWRVLRTRPDETPAVCCPTCVDRMVADLT